MAPIRHVESVPDTIDLNPSDTASSRRFAAGRLQLERQWPAVDMAEHKAGAGSARGRHGIGSIADHREGELELRNFEEQHRKRHREAEPYGSLAKRHGAAVFADYKTKRQQAEYADDGLNRMHVPPTLPCNISQDGAALSWRVLRGLGGGTDLYRTRTEAS
jgi:hypothetical protein